MSLWIIFLTGLTSGGLSCLAMQGGLLTSVIANQKESELSKKGESELPAQTFDLLDWLPVTLFLGSKLMAHTLLGFLLGWLGSQIELSLTMRLIFQGIAVLFMLATAGNLLQLHPLLRYVVLQPPRFLQRFVRGTKKQKAVFTPAILGFLTIFIPCGVTQAMEVLAITSGNAPLGAAILFFFVLGTSPVFALVGIATAKLSEAYSQKFMKLAAALLVLLALSNLNGILVVLDAPISFQKLTQPFQASRLSKQAETATDNPLQSNAEIQDVRIQVGNNGYSPRKIQVRAGTPVRLTLTTNETYSCASSFVLKAFNVTAQLGPTDTKTVTFTPKKTGNYQFSCSMGMYTGTIEVL